MSCSLRPHWCLARLEGLIMKTYEQLMQAYEKAAMAYHKAKPMTQAASNAGKRMDKAIEALEQFRANQQ